MMTTAYALAVQHGLEQIRAYHQREADRHLWQSLNHDDEWEKVYAFAEAVRKQEREACLNCYSPDDTASDWADKIRARGMPKERCAACGYQHGHAIGCTNNPVDAAIRAKAIAESGMAILDDHYAEMRKLLNDKKLC